jgi:capsid assembly protease
MKNYLHLHNLVFNQPHMCTPDYAETVLAVLTEKLNLEEGAFQINGEAKEAKPEGLENGIQTISILGSMVHRGGNLDALSGVASYEAIQNKLQAALDNPEVKSVLLDIDSSGGSVAGAFDLRDFILEAKEQKPIYALARDTMASAAYLIGSAATKVYATQTAQVGSIGVVAMHVDQSERNKQEGIKPTFIHAGDMKVAGNPHEPLEGESLSYLQESVQDSYEMFVEAVAEARGLDPQAIRDTQARVYKGRKAKSLGLVDGVRKIETVKKELAELSQNPASVSTNLSTVKGLKMENEIDVEKLEADYTQTKANLELLTSAVLAEGYTITEDGISKEVAPEMMDFGGELVEKASIPAPVLKKLEAAMAAEAEAALTAKAEDMFPNLSADAGKAAVEALASLGDNAEHLERVLKAANANFGELMEEVGEADVDGDMSDPKAKLDKMISDHMEANGVNIHKARTEVLETKEGLELFKAITKG